MAYDISLLLVICAFHELGHIYALKVLGKSFKIKSIFPILMFCHVQEDIKLDELLLVAINGIIFGIPLIFLAININSMIVAYFSACIIDVIQIYYILYAVFVKKIPLNEALCNVKQKLK